jgi:hypothetical protein
MTQTPPSFLAMSPAPPSGYVKVGDITSILRIPTALFRRNASVCGPYWLRFPATTEDVREGDFEVIKVYPEKVPGTSGTCSCGGPLG